MIDGTLSADALMQAGAALLVGAAQFALIWAGLRQMNKASVDRNRQLDMQAKTLGALVRGLETVIERTGGREKS